MAKDAQIHHHFAAAVEWVTGIFGINPRQQQQLLFIGFGDHERCIDSGTGDTRECALPGYRQWIEQTYPSSTVLYWLVPSFFFSQSKSIFNRPISE